MMQRLWTTYTFLAALVVASVMQPWRMVDAQDLNGDTRVDVLDVQMLVASLLSRGNTDPDLNGDGRVDVLDLQAFLACEGRADSQGLPGPSKCPPALSPAPTSAPQPQPYAAMSDVLAEEPEHALSRSREVAPRRSARTGTIRYLFRLTSHAPPDTGRMPQV